MFPKDSFVTRRVLCAVNFHTQCHCKCDRLQLTGPCGKCGNTFHDGSLCRHEHSKRHKTVAKTSLDVFLLYMHEGEVAALAWHCIMMCIGSLWLVGIMEFKISCTNSHVLCEHEGQSCRLPVCTRSTSEQRLWKVEKAKFHETQVLWIWLWISKT